MSECAVVGSGGNVHFTAMFGMFAASGFDGCGIELAGINVPIVGYGGAGGWRPVGVRNGGGPVKQRRT